jgi:hypothetical protein
MSPERKRLLVSVILAVAATAAVVVLIGKAAHYANLLTHLRDAQPGWLLLCAAGEALAYAGFIASYQAMAELDGGPKLTYSTVARIVGLSFGAFSVATAIGGLSVDFWALREAGEPPRLAGARIIALETMRWAMLTLATCAAAIIVLAGASGNHVPWVVPVAWLVITPACFAAGLWISAPRRRARFTRSSGGRLRDARPDPRAAARAGAPSRAGDRWSSAVLGGRAALRLGRLALLWRGRGPRASAPRLHDGLRVPRLAVAGGRIRKRRRGHDGWVRARRSIAQYCAPRGGRFSPVQLLAARASRVVVVGHAPRAKGTPAGSR